jgi:hypothetical protein
VPVRTSTVVAVGLLGLTVIGIATIFGNSLLALTAPPGESRGELSPGDKQASPPPGGTGAATDAGTAPGTSAGTDGGAPTGKAVTKDGS